MAEPTSHCCVAKIGAAAPDVEARLVQWASTSCQAHCLVRDGDGKVSLYIRRKEAKPVRAMQSLIRTLTSRWGLHMGDLGKRWLSLCTEGEFQAAACDAGERPRTHAEPPHITEQAIVYHCPDPCAEAGAQRAALLLSLSPDFDRRSQELYQIMLVAQAAH